MVEVFKIVLIGDCGVGKTNLLSSLIDSPFYPFEPKHISTIEAYHLDHLFKIDGKTIKAQIWDKAGKKNVDDDPFKFYKRTWGVVVVYDITDCQTFSHVEMWLTVVKKIDDFDVVVMLVGNKSDLQHLRCVSFEEAQEFANKKGLFFIETSALTSTNVIEAFHKLVREIIPVLEKKKSKLLHESDTDDGSDDSIHNDDNVYPTKSTSSFKKKCHLKCCCWTSRRTKY